MAQCPIFVYFDHPVTNAYIESANNLIRAMHRMGRGYLFDALRAKMLYAAGVQRTALPRYGAEPFAPVLGDMMRQHQMMHGPIAFTRALVAPQL